MPETAAALVQEAYSWVCHKRSTGNADGAKDWVDAVQQSASHSLAGARVLVFVNPACGDQLAQAHCDEIVLPMLSAMGCLSVEVQQTDVKKSAMELLGSADLSGLDAVRTPRCPPQRHKCMQPQRHKCANLCNSVKRVSGRRQAEMGKANFRV